MQGFRPRQYTMSIIETACTRAVSSYHCNLPVVAENWYIISGLDWGDNLTNLQKGNVHLAANYRSISLTSVVCKVMEHILCKHILNHLDLHNIMSVSTWFPQSSLLRISTTPDSKWFRMLIWPEDPDRCSNIGLLTCIRHCTTWTSSLESWPLWYQRWDQDVVEILPP